jgi:hypothetical protein
MSEAVFGLRVRRVRPQIFSEIVPDNEEIMSMERRWNDNWQGENFEKNCSCDHVTWLGTVDLKPFLNVAEIFTATQLFLLNDYFLI